MDDSKDELYFDLDNPRDREKVLFKLREKGWVLKEGKRGGKPWYQFVKHHPGGIAGGPDHPDREILIGQVVESEMGNER
jgi:hypothetical protein